jgi:hypothetical protein
VKWNVLGEVCIGIFANREINEDEELTFDYQFDAFNTPLTKCLCTAQLCKGGEGNNFNKARLLGTEADEQDLRGMGGAFGEHGVLDLSVEDASR